MLEIKTDDGQLLQVEQKGDNWTVNGKSAVVDMIRLADNKYHLLIDNRSVMIELLQRDDSGKNLDLVIDGMPVKANISDEHDRLLAKLGMDKMASTKLNQIKAPMPGLVLRMMVKEGDQVKKGDGLLVLVLEAMKMENVIKAPEDLTIKKIEVQERTAVEKNQVLITL